MTDIRLKLAIERLSHLEEELASAVHHAIAGDPEASAERIRLQDQIEAQKLVISELEASS
jgi:hypothetical protein